MGERRKVTILTIMKIIRYCNVMPATIKELATYVGRSSPDIHGVVKDMVEMGVLKEMGKMDTGGVRAAQLYEYNRDYKW